MAVIVNKCLKILVVLTFVQFSASRSYTRTTATYADYNELGHDITKRDVWGQRGSYEPMHQEAVPDNDYDDETPLRDEPRYYRNLPENGPEINVDDNQLNSDTMKQLDKRSNIQSSPKIVVLDSKDPCSDNPCKNDAICRKDPNKPWTFQCACTLGYRGHLCSFAMRGCNEVQCKKVMDCFLTPGGALCICVAASSSTMCQMEFESATNWEKIRTVLDIKTVHTGETIMGIILGVVVLMFVLIILHFLRVKGKRNEIRAKYAAILKEGKVPSDLPPDWWDISLHMLKRMLAFGAGKDKLNNIDFKPKKSSSKHGSKSSNDELAHREDALRRLINSKTSVVYGDGARRASQSAKRANRSMSNKSQNKELAYKEDALIYSKTSLVYDDGASRASQSASRASRSRSNKSQHEESARNDDPLSRLINSKTSVVSGDGARRASQSASRASRSRSNQSQYGTTPNQSQNNIIAPRTPSRQHLMKRSAQRLPHIKTTPTAQAYTRHKNSSQNMRKISSINKFNGRHTSFVKHTTTETEDSSEDSDSSVSESEITEKSAIEQVYSSHIEDRQTHAADESFNASLDKEDERSRYFDNGSYQNSRAYREPNSQYHKQNDLHVQTGRGKLTNQERQPILRFAQSSKRERNSQRKRTSPTPKISTTPLSERIARLRNVHNQSKDKILIKKSYMQQQRYKIICSSNEEEVEYDRRNHQDYRHRNDQPHWNKNMNTNTGYECESSFIKKSHIKQPILSKFRLPNNDENFCMNNNVVNEYSDLGIEHVYCDPQCESESLCGKEYLHIDETIIHASGKCEDIGQADTMRKENTKLIATADTHNDVSRGFNNDEQNIQKANKKENTLDDNKSFNEMYGIFATTITLPSREKENHEDNEENEMRRNNSDFYQTQFEKPEHQIIKHDDSSTKLKDNVNTPTNHDFKHYGCVVETVSLAENHNRYKEQGLCEKQAYSSRERHTLSENEDKFNEQHCSSRGTYQTKKHMIIDKDTTTVETENTEDREEQYIKSYEKDGRMLFYVDDSNDYGITSNCFDAMNDYSINNTPSFEFTTGTYGMNVIGESEANDFEFSDGSTDGSRTIVAASRSNSFVNDGRLFDNTQTHDKNN